MKPLLFFCLALVFFTSSQAQYADSSVHNLQADYLKKSKNQKTAGWILLGGGALLTTIGSAVGLTEVADVILDPFSEADPSSFSAGAVLTITGLTAMVGSIPLFIASGKNKRKAAASVSFRVEKIDYYQAISCFAVRYPAIVIRVRV